MAAQILGVELIVDTATLVGVSLACLALGSILVSRPTRGVAARTPAPTPRRRL